MLILMEKLLKLLFKIAVSKRLYTMLSLVYSFVIEELTANGGVIRPSKHAENNKITILILSSKSFRKDIDYIVATNEFRVLRIPDHWQSRLIFQFYPEGFQKFWVDTNPDHADYKYKNEQKELRVFLQKFLKRLYKRIRIDCVISPHPRYVVDRDWGAVSTKMGIPHILLPRDSQFTSSPYLFDYTMHLFKNGLPRFEGEHIIIQSALDKQVYTDSGYIKPEKISSLGCPRMDSFVKKTRKKKDHSENMRKKIVFLPFGLRNILEKSDLSSYICNVHLFFVDFALRYPRIDVVLKAKPKRPRSPRKTVLLKPLEGSSIELDKIPNLTIREDLDLHDLFFECDVVCGLNTSALLEAAVIGLPVIIPYFKDLQNQKYDERLFYRDKYELFDIAKDVNELESLILKRLHNQTIDERIMEGRKALFESFISSLDGDATEKYVTLIKEIVNKQNMHVLAKR